MMRQCILPGNDPSQSAGIATQHFNGLCVSIQSNTVMAVVPDSNRIPFFIYSANNFSNRIFLYRILFLNIISYLIIVYNRKFSTLHIVTTFHYRYAFGLLNCELALTPQSISTSCWEAMLRLRSFFVTRHIEPFGIFSLRPSRIIRSFSLSFSTNISGTKPIPRLCFIIGKS